MIGRRRVGVALVAAAAVLALAGCAPGGSGDSGDGGAADVTAIDGSITVFAAASLTGTFTELAERFEDEHPGASVELAFAGSSDLVTQITEGAPADVFASADERNMATLVDGGLIEESSPVDVATNTLRIVVPAGNPADIETLADLAGADVTTVLCAPQVPCGAATTTVQEAAGIDLSPVSEESSVTDVLGKVTSGEADAGLVYLTDVIAAGDAVEGIDFPESGEAVNVYPIAPLVDSGEAATAQAFVDFVAGETGREVLGAAGFGAP